MSEFGFNPILATFQPYMEVTRRMDFIRCSHGEAFIIMRNQMEIFVIDVEGQIKRLSCKTQNEKSIQETGKGTCLFFVCVCVSKKRTPTLSLPLRMTAMVS